MSSLNLGGQVISFAFQEELTSPNFNKSLRNIIKPGIYSPLPSGLCTIVSTSSFTLNPFTAWFNTVSNGAVSVSTVSSISVPSEIPYMVIDSTKPIFYMSYTHSTSYNSYLDFGFRAIGSTAVANEILICTLLFSGSNLIGFDYTDTTKGMLNPDYDIYTPGEINADTININILNATQSLTTTLVTNLNADQLDSAHKSIDGTFASNSDSLIPTEKAIDTYFSSGWIPARETWTYASTDSPTFTLTIPGDKTNKYSKDMKLRLQQDQALTGYWSFDSSSAPDIGSFTMADIGTPTYTSGKFGNALTLNGSNQALSITDNSLLKPTGDYTIGGWFKTSTTGAMQCLFNSYYGATNGGICFYISAGNILIGQHGNNGGIVSETNYQSLLGKTVVTDGNWHYASLTVKNNWMQLYLDGKLESSRYVFTPVYNSTNNVRIGCYENSGNSGFFNGQIDDLFLDNGYALDEETIRQKYLAGTAQGTGNITITKKFIISDNPSYSSGSGLTTLTLYGGTDFALANSTISNPYYSLVAQPYGFDRNPDKWSVIREDKVQYAVSSPGTGILYSVIGSQNLTMPIGTWIPIFKGNPKGYYAGNAFDMLFALSQSNNSLTDMKLRTQSTGYIYAALACCHTGPVYSIVAKTVFYLIAQMGGAINTFYLDGTAMTTTIKFEYANI